MTLILHDSRTNLMKKLSTPEFDLILPEVEKVPGIILPYQMALIYHLARQHDRGRILEIGAYHGRTAIIMALAAPNSFIRTLDINLAHVTRTHKCVKKYGIEVLQRRSWDYLVENTEQWDMIYIDGDHELVIRDIPWFNRLKTDGLILFHDFTLPGNTWGPAHPKVINAVDEIARQLGRDPDIFVMDDTKVGMAGFYRRRNESLTV